ncbi:MAG: S16 family serine protease [Candidatus Diapherotrites archaeon]|nr:S16 family serine protease [Candidatus Diapherotrites archaeon]
MAEFFAKAINVLFLVIIMFGIGFFTGYSMQPQAQKLAPITEAKLSASVNIVAVTADNQGVVSQASVEIIPGSGRILLSVNPFIEPDTQDSAKTAAQVAEKYTGKSLQDKDLILTIENSQAQLVGGPSAGAAFTLATIAAIEKKQVNQNAAITGTINSDGSIGQIGGVIEKATAAAEKGLSLFVVPKGQRVFMIYQPQTQEIQRGNLKITRTFYVSKRIDLQEYLKEQGYSIQIAEAASITEAAKLMLQ